MKSNRTGLVYMFANAEVIFLKRSVRVDGLKLRSLRNAVGLTQETAAQKSGLF